MPLAWGGAPEGNHFCKLFGVSLAALYLSLRIRIWFDYFPSSISTAFFSQSTIATRCQ